MSKDTFTDMMLGQVHPVILSSEHLGNYYSHGGVGTAFVLEYEGELFVITAMHVLNNQLATHDDLRILLRNAPVSILFDLRAVFPEESDPDLDSDLAILRVVKEQHAELYAAGLTSLDATCYVDTDEFGRADSFHVFGYPTEGREYDYEERVLDARLHWLRGELSEPKNRGLSTLKIVGNRPDDFNGMSGSVVIADIDDVWKFAGMVTLANESHGLLHFIRADKIAHHLNEMMLMEVPS
ncbi:hypothetical protein ACE1YR_12025 [Pseudomonas sp. K1(2024)]|uniref:Trypsin-like peptidase domain-containing protein n=1 Tax=Pseudomonas boreofloridensis TaxID=3064348 RepID=A0ABV4Z952_9PSED|nr:hypothetical protein [Pseudomonas sp. K13]MDO7901676.1 hypothetical protein [Pseudomonas sp. K13]